MTLPYEERNSLLSTRQFLLDLVSGKIKRVPKEVRMTARNCLRHYPAGVIIDDLYGVKEKK